MYLYFLLFTTSINIFADKAKYWSHWESNLFLITCNPFMNNLIFRQIITKLSYVKCKNDNLGKQCVLWSWWYIFARTFHRSVLRNCTCNKSTWYCACLHMSFNLWQCRKFKSKFELIYLVQGYIFWPFGKFLSKLKKKGKNLKEDLKKGKEKWGKEEKKEKRGKTHVKIS